MHYKSWMPSLTVVTAIICLLMFCWQTQASISSREIVLGTGVSLSGFEFGGLTPPGTKYVDYYLSTLDFNLIRLPFRWEVLQPDAYGDFDTKNWNLFTNVVNYTLAKGSKYHILLDCHNYGKYQGDYLENSDMLYDLWSRIAEMYGNNDQVYFGLMNEPTFSSTATWWAIAQNLTNQLRADNITNVLTVPGNSYSGLHNWNSVNGPYALNFTDPMNNYVLEMHQYFDQYSSGTVYTCYLANTVSKLISQYESWASEARAAAEESSQEVFVPRAFIGEWAAPTNDTACVSLYTSFASHLYSNSPSLYAGWTWWGAGPWSSTYPFLLQTSSLQNASTTYENIAPYIQTAVLPGPELESDDSPGSNSSNSTNSTGDGDSEEDSSNGSYQSAIGGVVVVFIVLLSIAY